MTLDQALNKMSPGSIIRHGKPNESSFIEIFMLDDCSLRFSDPLMEINDDALKSKEWY